MSVLEGLGKLLFSRQLKADRATFLTSVSAGTAIANLSDPFGGGSTFATSGTVPGQLALSGATIVAGTTVPTAGSSYALKVRATSADGTREMAETMTFTALLAAPTLSVLSLSTTTGTVGSAASINILGATAGSTITGTPPDGMTLNSAARTISGTPTTAGTYFLVLTETLAGATNNPRSTTLSFTIAAAAAFGTFDFSAVANSGLITLLSEDF